MKRNNLIIVPVPTVFTIVSITLALAYTLFVAYPLISGPALTAQGLYDPISKLYTIAGVTERVSAVSVNGQPTPILEDGSFSAARVYPPGYTVVTVRAEDRFGRFKEKRLTFVNSNFTAHASKKESPNKGSES